MSEQFPAKGKRHKIALDTARYEALKAANAAAKTDFKSAEDGKDSPGFRRVYVNIFSATYARVLHA